MKTKKYLLVGILFIVELLFLCNSYSQSCHGGGGSSSGHDNHGESNAISSNNFNKYSSYGGIVNRVGKYNIEMVFQPIMKIDPLVFFFMNKKGKPVNNQGISGKAEFTYSDNNTESIAIEPRSENGFAVQMKKKNLSFICQLTLQINGENIISTFHGSTTENTNRYICSMHPEITDNKPGNCPKCGMELVEKNSENNN